ncbi:RNA pseudouridine synthase [Leptospira sp. 201903070]|uniref:RNA pseudouridine synthase n=1 Tax=Leptospira ainlahdjerensis TaxID=2810033 RepID=A0ABS2UBS9_9LEPT|nr:RNA pseudouridine synthase [Leptospira ainlahdjerensis]MBM9577830.1 RNA pseudouridine synthase [Leptospira ainlahdjerensis]
MPKEHSNFRIFYQSDSFLFAEKPAGIPVHATKDSKRENFSDLLQKELGLPFLRTVNRLDLDTSGLVFFCKDPEKNKEADKILKTSVKIYLCIATGIVPEDRFTETCYLKDGNKRVKKVFSGGDKAVTEFVVLKRNSKENYSVLLAKLQTGRRHQIRFHLSEKGFPIVGDHVYGFSDKSLLGDQKQKSKTNGNPFPRAKRSLLHATGVSFFEKEGIEEKILCPPPQDFQKFLEGISIDPSLFSEFSLK